MRVTLLYNPTAGEEDHELDTLESLVSSAGHEVVSCSLDEDGWKDAFEDPGELVVVAGGDGSVGSVFRAVATNDVPVTVLPLGSANNVARTLGIADAPIEELVRGWERGRRVRFDLGQASAAWGETLFVESIGGGIFGRMLERGEEKDADEGEKDGDAKLRVGLELLRSAAADAPPLPWRVEVAGADVSGDYLAVEVTIVREVGPHFPLVPEAPIGDGMLDVVLIRAEDREELVGYFGDRLAGGEPRRLGLTTRRGDRVVLRPPAECPLHVDDELWPEDPDARGDGSAVLTPGPSVTVLVPRLGNA